MSKLYISCTTKDFLEIKEDLLSALGEFPALYPFKTSAEAASEGVVQRCLADVAKCDVYVGLIGFHYGWVPPWPALNPEKLSMTELEFREATKLGKKRLLFLAAQEKWNAAWVDLKSPERESVAQFRSDIENDPNLSFEYFSAEKSLKLPFKIVNCLEKFETEKGGARKQEVISQPPYPGLFSFNYNDRSFYFGRESEIEIAKTMLNHHDCNFLIVSGASGTGKSSLVEAGILPRLRPAEITGGSTDWFLRIRPAEDSRNPLFALAYKLTDRLPGRPLPKHLVESWMTNPDAFCHDLYSLSIPIRFIVLDQLEELFTTFDNKDLQNKFVECLAATTKTDNPFSGKPTTVLASIRSDFRDHCQSVSALNNVLQKRHYIDLFQLSAASVYEMIQEPAKKVGIDTSEVIDELVDETSSQPASLPLLATTLRTLWDHRHNNRLSSKTLASLGGMKGIISRHADAALDIFEGKFGPNVTETAFDSLFSELVRIDIDGNPVRRLASISEFKNPNAMTLAGEFAAEHIRLMYFGRDSHKENTLEVVHESLFRSWKPLNDWIQSRLTYEREIAQARFFASDWRASRERQISRLELVRIHDAHKAMKVLGMFPEDLDETTRNYLFPKQYLESLLEDPVSKVTIADRIHIGNILDQVNLVWDGRRDDRLGTNVGEHGEPNGGNSYWVAINKGNIQLELSPDNTVEQLIDTKFCMAKFPVTQSQFKAFVNAEDGYIDPKNWPHLTNIPRAYPYSLVGDNRPVVNVAWIEATAYCRWLNRRMKNAGIIDSEEHIRLPTEQEWQLASINEKAMQEISVGQKGFVETPGEVGIIAVGLSPNEKLGETEFMDFSSYIWEWCLNQFDDFEETIYESDKTERAVRGGSFLVSEVNVRKRFRGSLHMLGRDANIGFRVCISKNKREH